MGHEDWLAECEHFREAEVLRRHWGEAPASLLRHIHIFKGEEAGLGVAA